MHRRVILLSLCLTATPALAAEAAARATLLDSTGKHIGTATFSSADGGVSLQVKVSGLLPGRHGIHVHGAAKCDPPEFKTAGGHFNPSGRHHGLQHPQGAHAGDIPNLDVGADGTANATMMVRGVTLGSGDASLLGGNGTALVIHADPDDGMSDPAGNSGARIACGVIEKS